LLIKGIAANESIESSPVLDVSLWVVCFVQLGRFYISWRIIGRIRD
jgi:hypothetical protein